MNSLRDIGVLELNKSTSSQYRGLIKQKHSLKLKRLLMKSKNGYGQYWTHYERYRTIYIVPAYRLPHTGHSSISYAPYGTKMTDFSCEKRVSSGTKERSFEQASPPVRHNGVKF